MLRFLLCSLPSLNNIYKKSGQSQGLICRRWIRSPILGAKQLYYIKLLDKNHQIIVGFKNKKTSVYPNE